MAECIKCKSTRIVSVYGKTSDLNDIKELFTGHEHYGYVPPDMNLTEDGDEDYLNFDLCLNCGTIQAEWPVPETKLERGVSYQED